MRWFLFFPMLLILVSCGQKQDLKTKTPEELLAIIDNVPKQVEMYATAMDKAEAVFSEERMKIADMTVNIQKILSEKYGYSLTCIEILTKITDSIPEMEGEMSYKETGAMWLVLIEGGATP